MFDSRHLLAVPFGLLLVALLPPPLVAQQGSTLFPQAPYTRPTIGPGQGPGDPGAGHIDPRTATLGRGAPQGPSFTTGYNPYLHTAPAAPGVGGPVQYGVPYGGYPGYYPGYGSRAGSTLAGYGQAMQGMASMTSAAGGFYKDVQSAALQREGVRQTSIDTRRKQIEFELWYEGVRPTAPKMIEAERQTDLERARRDPPFSEISSGWTLNVLLKSVLASPAVLAGPTISLPPETLTGLNLSLPATRGTVAMAKDEGRIDWTEALQDTSYDEVRDRFSKTFTAATVAIQSGEPPARATLNSLRADLKQLEDQLDSQVATLPPSRYIESRRLLNQLKDNIRGMSDRQVTKASASGWRQSVRSVRDLVAYCQTHGMQFGPAMAPGDASAYMAAYYAMRSYERGVVQLASGAPVGGR